MTYSVGSLFGWVVDYLLNPRTIGVIILTSILVSLLSTLYPIYRTLEMTIVRGLT